MTVTGVNTVMTMETGRTYVSDADNHHSLFTCLAPLMAGDLKSSRRDMKVMGGEEMVLALGMHFLGELVLGVCWVELPLILGGKS
mmetsp:Transcript_46794/g.39472  ORF Transcript_46794/g.39472 Transcript_46794/m.39472 type:complete len:85 (+) Transcript_46794:190-444(+)